ncbi:MAG: aldolase catalytic domain-containing protein [Bacteroidales bacterium]|jgi:4-hydroxy 2-oxovalerate aldolase|nr:aldolase catalytic domain-containing protein [Bacteroidales bacterium]
MKNSIALLDCTLRDGGYINDWNFGHNTLINVFERLASAQVNYIEIGFLDQRRPFDMNRSIMPNTQSANIIYDQLDKKNAEIVGMIDFGTCDVTHIQPCAESILDGIRVIFKKHIKEQALAFCKELKQLGYKVFTQAVSITSYNDEELLELIALVNEVQPFAVSIVDTYGLLNQNKLMHYYEMMSQHLDETIGIGYHSHNNFQLGYANCIELINKHATANRLLLLDGTLFGMGKGAGNAPTELIATYLNENCNTKYDISQMLEAIDVNLMDIFKNSPWGYSMNFFIAASNDCHPNYVSYLLDKKTLSVKSINEILKHLEGEKKLLYDKAYIEELYINYQTYKLHDTEEYSRLSTFLQDKKVLIIGPGLSVKTELQRIKNYISQHNPMVMAINFVPEDFEISFLFLTNSKRYVQQATHLKNIGDTIKIIATSNISKSTGNFDFNLDYETLIDRSAVFMDNSFLMLLRALIRAGVSSVALAGFDGYSLDRATNYYSSKMEYDFARQQGDQINANVNQVLSIFKKEIDIQFITDTLYKLKKEEN